MPDKINEILRPLSPEEMEKALKDLNIKDINWNTNSKPPGGYPVLPNDPIWRPRKIYYK